MLIVCMGRTCFLTLLPWEWICLLGGRKPIHRGEVASEGHNQARSSGLGEQTQSGTGVLWKVHVSCISSTALLVAGLVSWLRAGWSGDRIPAWARNVYFVFRNVQADSGAHPVPFSSVLGGGGLIFLTIKRQRNSLTTTLSRTEFEGMWSSTSTPFTQPYGMYRDTVTYFTFAHEFAVAWSFWRNLGGSR